MSTPLPPLVLASASPRRRDLLGGLGVPFECLPVDIDERPHGSEEAVGYARRVARAKAEAGHRRRPDAWILAADTIVVIDGLLLGKPADVDTARTMLRRLSGRIHRVLTGVVLLGPTGATTLDEVIESHVYFRDISVSELESYLATGEPLDKAGAYAVQGLGGRFVEHVDGSLSSVIGLPVEEVAAALRRCEILR